MLCPTTGVNRAVRALSLGVTCVAITVAGHALANGHVAVLGISLVSVIMLCLAAFATSRELTFARLISFALLAQAGSHVMLSVFAPHSASGHSGTAVSVSMDHMHGGASTGSASQFVADAPVSIDVSPTMALIHIVMCVAMAVLLRHGEKLYFQLHRLLPELLRVLLGVAVPRLAILLPIAQLARALPVDAVPAADRGRDAQPITRRGPPLLNSFA